MSERPVLWRPMQESIESSNLARFQRHAAERGLTSAGATASDGVAAALHPWSVADPAAFWSEVWELCGVVASAPATRVVDDPARMPGARWFEGARLNFAE